VVDESYPAVLVTAYSAMVGPSVSVTLGAMAQLGDAVGQATT